MKSFGCSLLFFLISLFSWATHNRAGEIVYKHINGFTYDITVVTYTDPASVAADRCAVTVDFGDFSSEEVPRSNGTGICSGFPGARNGVQINPKVKENRYTVRHTYPGNGVYTITMEDPNRNEGIRNIPNSVGVVFFLESTLIISPLTGFNNSPELRFPPIDEGCVNQSFFHTPGAVDPDGDSLVYSFVEPLREGGAAIQGYTLPHINNSFGQLLLDSIFGIVEWKVPVIAGEYNIALQIEEYRRSPFTNQRILVGKVKRDMQVTIVGCNNLNPEFEELDDFCLLAGDSVSKNIVAYDKDNSILLSSQGDPYETTPAARFTHRQPERDTATALFEWQTDCDLIRKRPYFVYFKAEDNQTPTLVNFQALSIQIIGPEPINLLANPVGNNIQLSWDAPFCSNVEAYNVYRRVDSSDFVPDSCQTGIPSGENYVKIAEISDPSITAYTDGDAEQRLSQGQKYCYRVVAVYKNNYEGRASAPACAQLLRDLPLPTKVSVSETDVNNGTIEVNWLHPVEFDSLNFPGPYAYRLLLNNAQNANDEIIFESAPQAVLTDLDTSFTALNLNTNDFQHNFSVVFLSNDEEVGESQKASSVYLSIEPFDRELRLSWEDDVPWVNNQYFIYRFSQASATFELLDSTNQKSYRDRNLVNEREYTYFVESRGKYSIESIPQNLFNRSQEVTAAPLDTIPPCPPIDMRVESSCDLDEVKLQWGAPLNDSCFSDVFLYRVYRNNVLGGDFELYKEINDLNITSLTFANQTSIAGCYAVTAVDSFLNESVLSEAMCVDNCPLYELPNVFTPNGDGVNDFLIPFPYKYVERVDFKLYNRWGRLVFETTDPNIVWDGISENGKPMPNGVYFYVCDVYEIRLTGIERRTLNGSITILGSFEGDKN